MQFRIDNMTCGGCVRSVTRTIQRIDPQAQVNADIEARIVTVESERDQAVLAAALTDDGYPPVVIA